MKLMPDLLPILRASPVIPVIAIDDPDYAVPLAKALLEAQSHEHPSRDRPPVG